jgi:hypothetical protein
MEAYAAMASPPPTKAMGAVDKLSYEIFSLLESKFLFGAGAGCLSSVPGTPARALLDGGRVRVLAIDGCGGAGAEDALLAAAALARLEAGLRDHTGDPDARVADFFDLAAGAGAGGVLAAMLFLRGADGRPRYTADEALAFVAGSVGGKKGCWGGRRGPRWARLFRGARAGDDRSFRRVFGDATLRDTVDPN